MNPVRKILGKEDDRDWEETAEGRLHLKANRFRDVDWDNYTGD